MRKLMCGAAWVLVGSIGFSQCPPGATNCPWTPVRNVIAAVASVPQAVVIQTPVHHGQIQMPTVGGCGGQAPSCGGGSVSTVYRKAPMQTVVRRFMERSRVIVAAPSSDCGGQASVCNCGCELTGCDCGRSQCQPTLAPQMTSDAYQIALRSAQYRAANGIKGHTAIESGRTSGVGWSTHNPRPMTCLGNTDPSFAVVRGRDGFYSTVVR